MQRCVANRCEEIRKIRRLFQMSSFRDILSYQESSVWFFFFLLLSMQTVLVLDLLRQVNFTTLEERAFHLSFYFMVRISPWSAALQYIHSSIITDTTLPTSITCYLYYSIYTQKHSASAYYFSYRVSCKRHSSSKN